jgi:hypothetical protein
VRLLPHLNRNERRRWPGRLAPKRASHFCPAMTPPRVTRDRSVRPPAHPSRDRRQRSPRPERSKRRLRLVPAADGSTYQEYVLTPKGRGVFPILVAPAVERGVFPESPRGSLPCWSIAKTGSQCASSNSVLRTAGCSATAIPKCGQIPEAGSACQMRHCEPTGRREAPPGDRLSEASMWLPDCFVFLPSNVEDGGHARAPGRLSEPDTIISCVTTIYTH